MPIIEVSEIKTWLGSGVNDSTENDEVLEQLEADMTVMIETMTGRRWREPTTVEEIHSGDGQHYKLWLRNVAVDGRVRSVEERTEIGGTWTTLETTDYEVRGRRLLRTGGYYWPLGSQNIRVRYEAGYAQADVPGDIRHALRELIESSWHNRVTATPALITEQTIDIPRHVGPILQKYKVVSGSGTPYEVL